MSNSTNQCYHGTDTPVIHATYDIYRYGECVAYGVTEERIINEFDAVDFNDALEIMNCLGYEIE